jgi:D-tyrosyl-tRNA(Tyr) deacylase
MRVVVQRVTEAQVTVEGERIAAIGRGVLLLVAFAHGDTDAEIAWMARKLAGLRMFADAAGALNAALADVGGAVLAVPNFTLLGDCRKGKRPSFTAAVAPEAARPLFARFVEALATEVGSVASGRFGASMQVALVNDGPVTLVLDV